MISRLKRNNLVLVLVILFALFISMTIAQAKAPSVEGDDSLFGEILEQVEISGRYRFVANIEQTLIPRPVPSNIGQSEERVDTRITGLVTLPDSALITLQFEGSLNAPPITLEQDEGRTYLLKDGERQEIENPLGATAPTVEFLSYLQAAGNIQLAPNTDHPDLSIYTFDIDGVEYANYVRNLGQSQLPPGQQNTRLMLSPILQQMTGSGELWVDADGYPRRQILDIYIPEINEQYHSQTHTVVDYVIEEPLAGVPSLEPDSLIVSATDPLAQPPVEGRGLPTSPPGISQQSFWSNNLLPTFALVLMLLLMYLLIKGHHWVRVIISIFMTISMVTTPFLQGEAYAREQKREDAMVITLAEALGAEQKTDDTDRSQAPSNALQQTTNESCGSGDTVTDSDQDGTTDFVERCLGTAVYFADSDGDYITDTLEIEGILHNSQTWYLNPLELDSNQDGLSDYNELDVANGGIAPHIDVDNDGVPNVWDDDNDNDGVGDEIDLDPFNDCVQRYLFPVHRSGPKHLRRLSIH